MARVKEFLELCGYVDEEIIKNDTPRLEEAMRRAKMPPGDVDDAIDLIQKVYSSDLELESVRKMLGVTLKRFMALMLARDECKKVVYGFMPGGNTYLTVALNLLSDDIFCDTVEDVLSAATSRLFNNINRYLEMGERHGLPPARAHCGLTLITLAVQAEDLLPPPDLIVTSNFRCDQQGKAAEMLAELWNVPLAIVDTVHDAQWGQFPEINERQVKYIGASIAEVVKRTEEILDVEISDALFAKSKRIIDRFAWLLDKVHHALLEADPKPLHLASIESFEYLVPGPERIAINEGVPAIGLLLKEIEQRIAEGFGVLPKGLPRVATECGMGGDMCARCMVEEAGLNVVIPLNAIWTGNFEKHHVIDWSRFKNAPTFEKIAAEILSRGSDSAADGHLWRTKEVSKEGNVDGILFTPAYQCRGIAGLPAMTRATIEKELGKPIIHLEAGAADGRDHNASTMKTRVEAFAELLRARKSMEEETK
jgi:benzoyl-CoA reductase/2-hydroxyglutaryl-CoA dehydratase subunit BcrC/BadD/HgdB